MAKYEIMMMIDPKEDDKVVETLVNSVFKNPKIQKLEQTELAYEINKSKIAHYFLIDVEATGKEIDDLTTKTNISKKVWRLLAINLDKEIGKEKSLELIAQRKEKLQRDRLEYLKQRESKARETGEKPYRRFNRYQQNKPPVKEGE